MTDFLLRPLEQGDRNYVMKSWLEDFRKKGRWADAVGAAYYNGHSKVVGKLLDNAATMLCVWQDTPDYILGWACTGPGAVVHYVYVRQEWRGHGIAKRLLAPFIGKHCRVTHVVKDTRLPREWILDPYSLIDW